jgi:hypothetical protein
MTKSGAKMDIADMPFPIEGFVVTLFLTVRSVAMSDFSLTTWATSCWKYKSIAITTR